MKRFQFQLDPLLRLRAQAKQLAEMRQAQALVQLETARGRVAQLENELREACELGTSPVGGPVSVNQLLQLQPVIASLQQRIGSARTQVGSAEIQYEQAVVAVRELAVQVESLETLKQSRRESHREEIDRQIQIQLDETVMRRWDARGSAAGRDEL